MRLGAFLYNKSEIMKHQIRQTVLEHLRKKKKFSDKGIKVLSLFFIDKVDNYLNEDGFIRKCFVEAFKEFTAQQEYRELYYVY